MPPKLNVSFIQLTNLNFDVVSLAYLDLFKLNPAVELQRYSKTGTSQKIISFLPNCPNLRVLSRTDFKLPSVLLNRVKVQPELFFLFTLHSNTTKSGVIRHSVRIGERPCLIYHHSLLSVSRLFFQITDNYLSYPLNSCMKQYKTCI